MSDPSPRLKAAFLIGSDSPSTILSIEAVCALAEVEVVGILLDTFQPPLSRRTRNLRRNLKREGVRYIPARLVDALADVTSKLVERVFPVSRARLILRESFPGRCFNLPDISRIFGVPVIEAGNLNSAGAAATLSKLGADLGIVIGTRVLKRTTFQVPRLGSINLHKGAVPAYRGMPPGFWEIYNGEKTAGITVHFVDDTLDTGDVVATSTVDILPLDTPDSLLMKLHLEGAKTLSRAVAAIQSGSVERMPQPKSTARPNSKPTRRQVAELARRLPHWQKPSSAAVVLKNVLIAGFYYSGIFALVKILNRRSRSRAAIVLYHRVNDISKDGVTTSLLRFAGHMDMLRRWYLPIASGELIRRLRDRENIPATSVAVHFDDCYRDVFLNAYPIMRSLDVPGAAFISSGFVDTDRVFDHDVRRSPFRFENLTTDDLRAMTDANFEIGAHTVNHVDLGNCPVDDARAEIAGSVQALERITGRPVNLFSYPFGRQKNIRSELRETVRESGCICMFSAFGGTVGSKTDLFDVNRFGASDLQSPLHLALEIEGISPNQLLSIFRRKSTGSMPG